MVAARRFELAWRERPQEEAAHFNPAFCGELLTRTIDQFRRQADSAMPLVLSFLVLPLVLHPGSRRALPRRANTAFASWAGDQADVISILPDRVLRLRPVTREALLFLAQIQAISLGPSGIALGQRPMRLTARVSATTDEVDGIRRAAGLLGRWFAYQSDSAAVLQTMGVQV